MDDIEKKQKELVLNLDEELGWDSGVREYSGVDAVTITEVPDNVKECLEELLADYINDENNYVVEGANVTCDQMSNKPVQMYYWNGKLGIKGEGGSAEINYELPENGVSLPCFELDSNETEIGRFHAINSGQHTNGLRFATISDCSCLRDKIEKENMKEGKDIANLVSIGNCKIMKASDVLEINKRKGRAKLYGTCYCLMKPEAQWVNPYCTESLLENNDQQSADVNYCYLDAHHHTMNWNIEGGQEEGLTRLSTLLCTRGGIITFTWSGQSVQSSSEEMTIDGIGALGDDINVKDEILKLSKMDNGRELIKEYLIRIKSEYPDYAMFLELLAKNESMGSGDYSADNGSHFGRYQIGWGTLQQINFTDKDGKWTELANSLGAYDKESFKTSEVAQEVAILLALRWDYQQILSYGDDQYIGETVDGVEVTLSGVIAAGHLVGTKKSHKGFTREESWSDIVDGNGTRATAYMEQMKGLDMKGILIGIE